MAVPLTKGMTIPTHQLSRRVAPSIFAMPIGEPSIIGAAAFINSVMASVPTKPPKKDRETPGRVQDVLDNCHAPLADSRDVASSGIIVLTVLFSGTQSVTG